MAHFIEITPIDNQIPLLPQTKKNEIDEGRKVDDEETNNVVLQTKRSANQIFAEKFKDLDTTCIKLVTIFKVNAGLRKSNPDAYTPMLISIGPYHKKNPQLGSMEKYKLLYLRRFLKRREGLDVESCIIEIEKLKSIALRCYEDNLDIDIVENFSEMLLLDGCFLVEFIREFYDYKPDDIINLNWMMNQVCRDMVLLENQLPFFVLVMLYRMTTHPTEENFLSMVRSTLLSIFPKVKNIPISEIKGISEQFDHLLDAAHMFCRPSKKMKDEDDTTDDSTQNRCCKISFCGNSLQPSKEIPPRLDFWQCYNIPTARELFDSGVSFLKVGYVNEKPEDKATLFDITFEKGIMKIPCFTIEDTMDTFMRNMIAFEQHTSKVYPFFSNYAHIMTQLIGSHRDVNFLRQNKIILKDIGDDKQVANIFKKLSEGVAIHTQFYYEEECSRLIQHCEKPWSQMKASLKHNYFQSPWTGASTVAAITLLVLTVIQTVLAFTGSVNK